MIMDYITYQVVSSRTVGVTNPDRVRDGKLLESGAEARAHGGTARIHLRLRSEHVHGISRRDLGEISATTVSTCTV